MQPIRKGITLLASFLDVIEEFPTYEMRADFIYKVYLYGTTGEEPIFDDALQRIAWKAIRPVVEHSATKYDTNVKNGAKGGRPHVTQANDGENPAETQEKPNNNPIETEPEPTEKAEKEKEKEKEKEIDARARTREDWRHLSSARLNYLRTNGQSIADFKRSLLLDELKDIAPTIGLSPTDIEAFMQKWGESSPGSDSIRAEYEPTFNVAERAKNYVGVGRPIRPKVKTAQELIQEEMAQLQKRKAERASHEKRN